MGPEPPQSPIDRGATTCGYLSPPDPPAAVKGGWE